MAVETLPEPSIPITTPLQPSLGFLTATPIIATATICLALVIASAVLAPWLSPHDPLQLAPSLRLKPASTQFLLGTDGYGRDLLSRILYGGRISLLIGLGAAVFSIGIGLVMQVLVLAVQNCSPPKDVGVATFVHDAWPTQSRKSAPSRASRSMTGLVGRVYP